MVSLLTLHEHVLYYQEQHRLFLFTADYMMHVIDKDGIVSYLGGFIIQFYHIPWLGAAVVSSLLTSVYLLIEGVVERVTGRRDYLQVGVAAAVALYFTLDGIDDTPGWVVVATVGLLIVWLVCRMLRRRRKDRQGGRVTVAGVVVPLVAATVYIVAGFWWVMRDYNRPERAMIRAERAVRQHDWDGALSITDKYLSTGRTNRLMLYLRNLSLAQKGILLDHLFDYPMRSGVEALIFSWKSDSRESEYGNLVHEATGNLNAAHHWAFEAMTIWGETPAHLIDLAKYNIAMGRPKVAQRFVNKLGKSLFYRSEAARLQRQIDGVDAPDVHYAWSGKSEERTRFINVKNPSRDLMEIVKADSTNSVARQYLTAVLLVANDQDALVSVLEKGAVDPQNVEEAKLIYSLYPNSTPLEDLGLKLTLEVRERYGRMYNYMMHNNRMMLEKEFGKTFWYYIYNYCPYGADKRNSIPSDTIIPGAELKH